MLLLSNLLRIFNDNSIRILLFISVVYLSCDVKNSNINGQIISWEIYEGDSTDSFLTDTLPETKVYLVVKVLDLDKKIYEELSTKVFNLIGDTLDNPSYYNGMKEIAKFKNLNFDLKLEQKNNWNNHFIKFRILFDFPFLKTPSYYKYFYERLMDGVIKIEDTEKGITFQKESVTLKLDYYFLGDKIDEEIMPPSPF